jgi:hypothetical protein
MEPSSLFLCSAHKPFNLKVNTRMELLWDQYIYAIKYLQMV